MPLSYSNRFPSSRIPSFFLIPLSLTKSEKFDADNIPYEKRGSETVCIKDEFPFEIPQGWELCRLREVCFLLDGEKYIGDSLPYLEAKVIRRLKAPEERNNGRFVNSNTTVILVDGENSGEVFTTHCAGILGSTFKVLHILNSIYKDYILTIIRTTTSQIFRRGSAYYC